MGVVSIILSIRNYVLVFNSPTILTESASSITERSENKLQPEFLSWQCPPPIKRKKHLEFIHIRKTGGSAIETAASRVGIPWGICKEVDVLVTSSGCDKLPKSSDEMRIHRATFVNEKGLKANYNSSFRLYHLPMQYWDPFHFNISDTAFFTVVRNPYDRVISEYYQRHKVVIGVPPNKSHKWTEWNDVHNKNGYLFDVNNATYMNQWVQAKIHRPGGGEPLVPQYEYVQIKLDDTSGDLDLHVLHFERLSEEFEELMNCYFNDTRITDAVSGAGNSESGVQFQKRKLNNGRPSLSNLGRINKRRKGWNKLNSTNFDSTTLKLIHATMEKDFTLFGYDMMT
eukprot:CAMPEP_0195527196 /NCGR_PEP_ID=MMETSP0794_2-20130614/28710_1 /TAXON_ID=515487 /ORGANISM="Stephanopyxis turris, Strain CCMP 815" /LENGTH=340 /DNA_ID=CAMNT_0040658057 /DNA_START=118 /DNA_END=1140 /DNA_ORIENTATION=+